MLAASRAARRAELGEEDVDDEEEDIDDDDGADDGADGGNAAKDAAKTAEAAEDAVPCTEGEDRPSLPGGAARREPPPRARDAERGGLMSALARLPSRAPGTAADDALAPYAATGPSQRGGARGAHRHGSNAPTARLQRIMHRARARQAQFLDDAPFAGAPGTLGDAANAAAAAAAAPPVIRGPSAAPPTGKPVARRGSAVAMAAAAAVAASGSASAARRRASLLLMAAADGALSSGQREEMGRRLDDATFVLRGAPVVKLVEGKV